MLCGFILGKAWGLKNESGLYHLSLQSSIPHAQRLLSPTRTRCAMGHQDLKQTLPRQRRTRPSSASADAAAGIRQVSV